MTHYPKIHKVIIANSISRHVASFFGRGSSGSLMIQPLIKGSDHYSGAHSPFVIGSINPMKGFIHVFDDLGIDLILTELDTITDFIEYLKNREQLLQCENFFCAAGEEEILAIYFKSMADNKGILHFIRSLESHTEKSIILTEGLWKECLESSFYKIHKERIKLSYKWDDFIRLYSDLTVNKKAYNPEPAELTSQEKIIRIFASENRISRSVLCDSFLEVIGKHQFGHRTARFFSTRESSNKGNYYVFLIYPNVEELTHDEYRSVRRQALVDHCFIVTVKFKAKGIVGIVIDEGVDPFFENDLIYFSIPVITDQIIADANDLSKETGYFQNLTPDDRHVVKQLKSHIKINAGMYEGPKVGRNDPCPCGSGRKSKRCCFR